MLIHFKRCSLLLTVCMLLACDNTSPAAKTDEAKPAHHDHNSHQHSGINAEMFNSPAPQLDFTVDADSSSGWNIHITTQHFSFTPENINTQAKANSGHAHVYVDGYKIARLYGPWYHLKALTRGEHIIRIELNANDHSPWLYNGKKISVSKTIIQP